MADDGSEIRVGHFVERVAFGERVRLDFEIVEVRQTLGSRFRIVAAITVLVIQLASQVLLITQGDLFDCQFNFLPVLSELSAVSW